MNKRLPLSAGTILQLRYTIVGQLGHGGMGAVYQAKDNRTSATIALKETYADDDYTRSAFEREAKMLANMTHEAFPRVMDYFAEGDGFYLVMELIRGKDFSELLEDRNAPFETQQVLEWADQILDALEDLHSQDIVHRDIKPSNLKLTPRGRIKLLDFGIAKGLAGDMTALQSTVGSMAAATLQYAPLEQVLRADTNWLQMLCVNFSDKALSILDHGTDARSDLYALGATLYHLLTNTLPVNAPTRALSIWSGLVDQMYPAKDVNPKVSPTLSGVLNKTLEVDREKRPRSASELRKMLSGAGDEKEEETVFAHKKKAVPTPPSPSFQNAKPRPITVVSKERPAFWLSMPIYCFTAAAVSTVFFFLVWKILQDEGEEAPWVTSGIGATLLLGCAIVFRVIRQVFMRKATSKNIFMGVLGGGFILIPFVLIALYFSIGWLTSNNSTKIRNTSTNQNANSEFPPSYETVGTKDSININFGSNRGAGNSSPSSTNSNAISASRSTDDNQR